jgi:hypothetical protein
VSPLGGRSGRLADVVVGGIVWRVGACQPPLDTCLAGVEAIALLLPALARITGLGGALALVVGDSGARHVGRGAEEGGANGRPAIG